MEGRQTRRSVGLFRTGHQSGSLAATRKCQAHFPTALREQHSFYRFEPAPRASQYTPRFTQLAVALSLSTLAARYNSAPHTRSSRAMRRSFATNTSFFAANAESCLLIKNAMHCRTGGNSCRSSCKGIALSTSGKIEPWKHDHKDTVSD